VAARLEGLNDERVEQVSVGLRSWEADADAGPDWQRPRVSLANRQQPLRTP
jgi:hypothetical protein